MIKTLDIFEILEGGRETTAKILGIYVYDGDIFMPVIIDSTNQFKVYQVMPHGLKTAGRNTTEEFATLVFAEEKVGDNGSSK